MPLFDVYLAVDWSARSRPSPAAPAADAVWIGEAVAASAGTAGPTGETYWRTRQAGLTHLRARLHAHTAAGRRVLVGWDFAFGYPAGTAAAFGLPGAGAPWQRMWAFLAAAVADDVTNGNNRFAVAAALNDRCGPGRPGPFWGCPRAQAGPGLAPTSPAYPYLSVGPPLARLRACERRVRGVQPVWKLLGTGSVGGQTLLGIPALVGIRADAALGGCSAVWPFETGFTPQPAPATGPAVVHTEIWPGLVPGGLDPAVPVRDQAQVRAVVRWWSALDAAGTLGAQFAAPAGLDADALGACVAEEGWILGG